MHFFESVDYIFKGINADFQKQHFATKNKFNGKITVEGDSWLEMRSTWYEVFGCLKSNLPLDTLR